MIKILLSALRILSIAVFLIVATTSDSRANDCRTMLGAYISPLYSGSDLAWGIEGTVAVGDLDGRVVMNHLYLLGLEYKLNSDNSFFVEGGFKTWSEVTGTAAEFNTRNINHLGMREIFWNLNAENTKLTVGLQTMTAGDYFLLDERVVGANYRQNYGQFEFSSQLGSVKRDFARMGDFCGTRKIFYMAKGTRAGDDLGETNLF
ncbi:MAG: hypothetical protein PF588_10870, partial [Candidatus Kapabacteria bacterium]|nr:hypothetical protein [Candidatus Kapabacteria bacterium]